MKNLHLALTSVLLFSVLILFTGCGNNKQDTDTIKKLESKITQLENKIKQQDSLRAKQQITNAAATLQKVTCKSCEGTGNCSYCLGTKIFDGRPCSYCRSGPVLSCPSTGRCSKCKGTGYILKKV
jgi:outer membrane murein-binding lipoprotein Lpp